MKPMTKTKRVLQITSKFLKTVSFLSINFKLCVMLFHWISHHSIHVLFSAIVANWLISVPQFTFIGLLFAYFEMIYGSLADFHLLGCCG